MKRMLLMLLSMMLMGCASTPVIKTESREALHFVTFKSEPIGADVMVIDTATGKEVGTFGKTPVRIMLFKNTIETDLIYKMSTPKNLIANAQGFVYGPVRAEGIEFQFRFRLAGHYDELKILRIPLVGPSDVDIDMNVTLNSMKK